MLFSLHKNRFRNCSAIGLTHFFDLKEEQPVDKTTRKTCTDTAKAPECGIKELEIWIRGMQKQGDLSRKAAAAADLAVVIWYALTKEQQEELIKRDSIRAAIKNLIGYGFSWSV